MRLARAGPCSAARRSSSMSAPKSRSARKWPPSSIDNAIWGRSDAPFARAAARRTPWAATASTASRSRKPARRSRFYWGGAMVGRAVGSALLARFAAPKLLATFTAIACAMCLYVVDRRRRHRRLRRAVHRPVQLDHVPGDLHAHAGAVDPRARKRPRASCAPQSSAAR